MKNKTIFLFTFLMIFIFPIVNAENYSSYNKWIYDNNHQSWYYLKEKGNYAKSEWVGSYYLKSNGKMAKSEIVEGKYYVLATGEWLPKGVKLSEKYKLNKVFEIFYAQDIKQPLFDFIKTKLEKEIPYEIYELYLPNDENIMNVGTHNHVIKLKFEDNTEMDLKIRLTVKEFFSDYKNRKNIFDILSEERLKEFVIDSGVGVRYYNGILTTDSFSLDDKNNIINSRLELLDKDLSVLDEIIISKNKGEIFDLSIENKIGINEKIIYKLSFITNIDDKPKLLRSYYVYNKEFNTIIKKIIIDVENGNTLNDKQAENLY